MLKEIAIIFFIFFLGCAPSLHKDTFIICNTFLEIQSYNKEAASIVYQEIKRLEKIFNFFDKDSEISKLNNTYNEPFKVSDELLEVLLFAQYINQKTEGAFDISYGKLYDFWKKFIKSKSQQLPPLQKIEMLKKIGGMQNILIDLENKTVTIKKRGLKIDLGGLAIGYMIDRAVKKLKENNINSALINLGGDVYCLGKNKNRLWKVGIRNPKNESIIKTLSLADQAVTTSGSYQQFIKIGNRFLTHIINPKTGYPIETNIKSITVVAKDCISADALATAFFVMGLDATKKFLVQNSHIKVFVVLDEAGKYKLLNL